MQPNDPDLESIKSDLITALKKYDTKSSIHFFRSSKLTPKFHKAKNFGEILDLTSSIEKDIYRQINDQLKKLNKNKNLYQQESILKSVRNYLEILINVNNTLIKKASQFLTSQTNPDLQEIVRRFQVVETAIKHADSIKINEKAQEEDVQKSNKNGVVFLSYMLDAVILSLIKANLNDEGRYFIHKFNETLSKNKHNINLMLNYKLQPSSFEISPENTTAYARAAKDKKNNVTFTYRAKAIKKNTGASSALLIPVWPDKEEEFEKRYGVYFAKEEAIQQAMNNLIGGSFSFDKDGTLFYTPFHLELLHEFLHALHNSRGANRELVKTFTLDEQKVWKDAEEYWAIEGGKISENLFNKMINAPARYGHNGISATVFLKPKENKLVLENTPTTLFGGNL